jgi:pimeloyl-ACP methyl ester carboxylesterase
MVPPVCQAYRMTPVGDDQVVARIVIIPGLAVRSYAVPAADALAAAGHEVDLRPAPAWRGQPTDLRRYGLDLAAELDGSDRPVDLLVGLSVGTQAAAVAATRLRVGHLLLISPTLDPARRSLVRMFAAWQKGEDHPDAPSLRQHLPDWLLRAGPRRIYGASVSAIKVHLEDVLPDVSSPVTVVHAEGDTLSDHTYAAALSDGPNRRFLVMPGAPHSWPIGDHDRWISLVDDLVAN